MAMDRQSQKSMANALAEISHISGIDPEGRKKLIAAVQERPDVPKDKPKSADKTP